MTVHQWPVSAVRFSALPTLALLSGNYFSVHITLLSSSTNNNEATCYPLCVSVTDVDPNNWSCCGQPKGQEISSGCSPCSCWGRWQASCLVQLCSSLEVSYFGHNYILKVKLMYFLGVFLGWLTKDVKNWLELEPQENKKNNKIYFSNMIKLVYNFDT